MFLPAKPAPRDLTIGLSEYNPTFVFTRDEENFLSIYAGWFYLLGTFPGRAGVRG
jgi:hypothetical protein